MSNHLILIFTSKFQTLPSNVQHEVYQEYYQLVYPMVLFIVKDHGAVEDILQEGFMRSIEKAQQLQKLEKLESWLKTLTRNVTLNYLRKFKRNREELDASEILQQREFAHHITTPPIEQQVETKLMEEAIIAYLSELRPEYREVFEMRWIDNLSYREMAAKLNVSEGIIRQKLYRAREMIKQKIQLDWKQR